MHNASGRDRAYHYLRDLLQSDPDLAGAFINEQQVAEEIGISRTPVREALLLLSVEGLVQLVPNRGALVPTLLPEQVHHILAARALLEAWAAHEALARGVVPLDQMRACLQRQEELLESGTNAEFIAVDREFHTALLTASGNPVICQMYEALRTRHVPIGVSVLRRKANRRHEVIAEHRAILIALEAGDASAAQAAVRAHLESTADSLTGR